MVQTGEWEHKTTKRRILVLGTIVCTSRNREDEIAVLYHRIGPDSLQWRYCDQDEFLNDYRYTGTGGTLNGDGVRGSIDG